MIVWLASFPRSGNTFFRILLHSLYGASTYTGFQSGDDLELDVGAGELTGNKRLPEKLMLARRAKDPKAVLREFDAHDEVYFIKTHNLPSELYDDEHRTLLFVRDPRDTFVSFGWWIINVEGAWRRLGRRFRLGMPQLPPPVAARRLLQHTRNTIYFNAYKALRGERRLFDKILRERVVPNDRWSKLNLGWADRKNGKTAVTRYEDMLATPGECVARALREIGLDLPLKGDHVPTFAELKAIHPHFFRQGKSGAWQKDFPGDLSDTLWRVHGEAMRRFGYSE